jgi:hypothetical protein
MEYVARLEQSMVENEAEWIRGVMDAGVSPDEIECQVEMPITGTYIADFVIFGEIAVEVKNSPHGENAARKGDAVLRQTDYDYHVVTDRQTHIPCDKVFWWSDPDDWVASTRGKQITPRVAGSSY